MQYFISDISMFKAFEATEGKMKTPQRMNGNHVQSVFVQSTNFHFSSEGALIL